MESRKRNFMRPIVLGILFCIALGAAPVCADKFGSAHLDLSAPIAASLAGIIALVLAAMPLRFLQGASATATMQTGLIATMIHMSILLLCAGLVMLGHVPVGGSFIFWLMAVYVITMIAMVASITSVIHQNPGTTTEAS
jgi:hypothetical protein